ncbi:MAG: manganese-binding transcriptional regulator MntR [Armatimonadetes bacterium]|nr:manganese-binding transcriptional regulator MntR [Armatimonadota bacterium]
MRTVLNLTRTLYGFESRRFDVCPQFIQVLLWELRWRRRHNGGVAEQSFRRTRDDHALETAADYVELIEDLIATSGEARGSDLAKRLGVSHVTVTKSLTRLARDGYVSYQPYRSVFLTEKGEALARQSRKRHKLVLDMLLALGVPPEIAEHDAEGMEHHVSEATLNAIEGFLSARAR